MNTNFKYNDGLEKILTAVFGFIGIAAILISLTIKGWNLENGLDAVKDVAGLIVAIAVFLLANKIFSFTSKKNFDFNNIFENHLKEWADHNKYLIDISSIDEELGKEKKRVCKMIINHVNFVEGNSLAKEISNKEKAAFIYLPLKEEFGEKNQMIQFKLNQQIFKRQTTYDYNVQKTDILQSFAKRINSEFEKSLTIRAELSREPEKIDVIFSGMEKTPENARRLIDVVEFVKTMVLAIA